MLIAQTSPSTSPWNALDSRLKDNVAVAIYDSLWTNGADLCKIATDPFSLQRGVLSMIV